MCDAIALQRTPLVSRSGPILCRATVSAILRPLTVIRIHDADSPPVGMTSRSTMEFALPAEQRTATIYTIFQTDSNTLSLSIFRVDIYIPRVASSPQSGQPLNHSFPQYPAQVSPGSAQKRQPHHMFSCRNNSLRRDQNRLGNNFELSLLFTRVASSPSTASRVDLRQYFPVPFVPGYFTTERCHTTNISPRNLRNVLTQPGGPYFIIFFSSTSCLLVSNPHPRKVVEKTKMPQNPIRFSWYVSTETT